MNQTATGFSSGGLSSWPQLLPGPLQTCVCMWWPDPPTHKQTRRKQRVTPLRAKLNTTDPMNINNKPVKPIHKPIGSRLETQMYISKGQASRGQTKGPQSLFLSACVIE